MSIQKERRSRRGDLNTLNTHKNPSKEGKEERRPTTGSKEHRSKEARDDAIMILA